MKRFTLIGFCMLAGCTHLPASVPQIVDSLERHYNNRPVNEFFFDYGQPTGEFDFDDGMRIYRWTSLQLHPGEQVAPARIYRSDSASYTIVDNYRSVTERQYCELRIYTDADDVIQKFSVAVDSMGKWSASRCSEIFSVRY